jgi:hypothetical protein
LLRRRSIPEVIKSDDLYLVRAFFFVLITARIAFSADYRASAAKTCFLVAGWTRPVFLKSVSAIFADYLFFFIIAVAMIAVDLAVLFFSASAAFFFLLFEDIFYFH